MRGIECSYAVSGGSRIASPGGSLSPIFSGTCPSRMGDLDTMNVSKLPRRVPDALLWQHYLVRAGKSMAATSTDLAHAQMWESSVPAVAFSDPVASHAIMALSALCLDSTACMDDAVYDVRATAELHYCQALERLRSSLPVVSQASADAVLACGMALIPCGLALNRMPDAPRRDWLYHLRGFRALGDSVYNSSTLTDARVRMIPYPQLGIPDAKTHQSNLGGGALWGPGNMLLHRIRRSWHTAIDKLKAGLDESDLQCDPADREACTAGLEGLEGVMEYVLDCRVSNFFRAIFTWPVQVPQRFAELMLARDHAALAIFMHWLVLTMALEDLWFVQDFGSRRIELLARWMIEVDSPYVHLLRWPVTMRAQWRGGYGRCSGDRDRLAWSWVQGLNERRTEPPGLHSSHYSLLRPPKVHTLCSRRYFLG